MKNAQNQYIYQMNSVHGNRIMTFPPSYRRDSKLKKKNDDPAPAPRCELFDWKKISQKK